MCIFRLLLSNFLKSIGKKARKIFSWYKMRFPKKIVRLSAVHWPGSSPVFHGCLCSNCMFQQMFWVKNSEERKAEWVLEIRTSLALFHRAAKIWKEIQLPCRWSIFFILISISSKNSYPYWLSNHLAKRSSSNWTRYGTSIVEKDANFCSNVIKKNRYIFSVVLNIPYLYWWLFAACSHLQRNSSEATLRRRVTNCDHEQATVNSKTPSFMLNVLSTVS